MKPHDITLFVGLFAGRETNSFFFLANQPTNTKFLPAEGILQGPKCAKCAKYEDLPLFE